MNDAERFCVVVDAYSTGRYLAKEFLAQGLRSVHVQSRPEIPSGYCKSFDPSDFICNIIHDGTLEKTLSELCSYDLVCLIPGAEPGVELADRLSERIGLPTNGSRMSAARRNKFEMIEALRSRGLRTTQHFKARCAKAIVDWAKDRELDTVVVKPPNSAGTDSVYVCESETEITDAVSNIIGRMNLIGIINEEVLAEEYLDGTEYVVNAVSRNGYHYIAEFWVCKKTRVKKEMAHANVYDVEKLLPYHGDAQSKLTEYISQVLDTLEIRNGPSHSEVMMTANGPVLIETAARLQGSINPAAIDECFGTNQVRLTVQAYLYPSEFVQLSQSCYLLRRSAYAVSLISKVEGRVRSLPILDSIRRLESFFSDATNVHIGGTLRRTIDLFTSPGVVYLVHDNREVLENDYGRIRQFESNGYLVE